MYLSELSIKGYKVFNDEFKIKLNQGLTVLIGENGCGKTAIVDAVRLLLNEDEFGRLGIDESHFHKPFNSTMPTEAVESITLRGTFHLAEAGEQIAYLPWLDASDNTRAYLNKKIDNKVNNRDRYIQSVWGGESVSGIFEWELIDAISCIYLPPLRDAENKLNAYRGSRLTRLFRKYKPKKGDPKHNIEDKFQEFNNDLLKDETIKHINEKISGKLEETLGNTFGQSTKLQFAELTFDRIVERLRLLFYPNLNKGIQPDQYREISQNSLGYNNVLYMATVLAELEIIEKSTAKHKILLIEEPEAHLHPQLQVKLLQYLKEQANTHNIQIIVTTHSSTITAASGLDALNVLTVVQDQNPKSTRIVDCGLDAGSKFFIERWLDITKSTMFFAKGILFVEGIAEALVIKELAKRVIAKHRGPSKNETLEDYGVSIVNLSGIYFKHFMPLFQGYKLDKNGVKIEGIEGIPIRCAGITDCDPLPAATTTPTKHNPCSCGNSQSTNYSEEMILHSTNGRIYTNLKTFEYDLAMEGNNLQVLYSIIADSYIAQVKGAINAADNSEKDWTSVCDSKKAEECLSFLKIIETEKGEFAQSLALKLSEGCPDFEVPKYIEDAVLWATQINPAIPND